LDVGAHHFFLRTHGDASALLDRLNDRGEILVAADFGIGGFPGTKYRTHDFIRNAECLRFFQTQPYVLEHQRGSKTEIELTGNDRFRELVGRRGVAARAGIDHVDHHRRIESGLYTHHNSF
jgi:hypothetical protein